MNKTLASTLTERSYLRFAAACREPMPPWQPSLRQDRRKNRAIQDVLERVDKGASAHGKQHRHVKIKVNNLI
jgi:hypothetical protein